MMKDTRKLSVTLLTLGILLTPLPSFGATPWTKEECTNYGGTWCSDGRCVPNEYYCHWVTGSKSLNLDGHPLTESLSPYPTQYGKAKPARPLAQKAGSEHGPV